MNRIPPMDMEKAESGAKELSEKIKAKMGRVPNIFKAMLASPATVEMYLGMGSALGGCALSQKTREKIALVAAEENQCDYCLAAHSAIAKQAGLTPEEIQDARRAKAADVKENAIIQFSKKLCSERGHIKDQDVAELRKAGVTDREIIEIIAVVSANIFTNYFNHVVEPSIDFPKVEPL